MKLGAYRPNVVRSILILSALIACGGDGISNPPPKPVLSIVSGNNQSAAPGEQLALPLTVAVTNATGAFLAGQTVTWTVTGGGTLSAATTTSDASGHASVTWTLGDAENESVVASIGSFGVAFSATAATAPPPPPPPSPIIVHYDGTSWNIAQQIAPKGLATLYSIWGASGSAALAVGGQCGNPIIDWYDGTNWNMPACVVGVPPKILIFSSVWGTSASDVFVVGQNISPTQSGTWVSHYDGHTWTDVYKPSCTTCANLHAVWSRSNTDAMAVGDSGQVLHYDGTNWTPQTSGTVLGLNAVFGIGAAGAIFAVGDGGTILRYDGTAWQAQASGTSQPLYAIWGTSATDLFAVGGNGVILHYDGNTWTAQTSGTTNALRGIWGDASSSVFAVGDQSTVLRYNGTAWTAQTIPAPMDLRGVWGTSANNVFAVGAPR